MLPARWDNSAICFPWVLQSAIGSSLMKEREIVEANDALEFNYNI